MWHRKLFGWTAVLLGSGGMLLSLAGLAGVWILHVRLQQPVAELFTDMLGISQRVEARAGDVEEGIQVSREAVGELQTTVQAWVRDLLSLSEEDVVRLREFEEQLHLGIQVIQDWWNFAMAVVDLADKVITTASAAIGLVTEAETSTDLVTTVRLGHEQFLEVSRLFDEARGYLEAIYLHENLPENSAALQSLAERIDAALEGLQQQAASFRLGVAELVFGIDELREQIASFLLIAALSLTLLLIWQTVAQACLALCGWRFRQSPANKAEAPVS